MIVTVKPRMSFTTFVMPLLKLDYTIESANNVEPFSPFYYLFYNKKEKEEGNSDVYKFAVEFHKQVIGVVKLRFYFPKYFSASLRGAVVFHAVVSASMNIDGLTFFKFIKVAPLRPQPPGTGKITSLS